MASKPKVGKTPAVGTSTELLAQQAEMDAEFNSRQPVRPLPYDISASQFTIPDFQACRMKAVSLSPGSCKFSRIIFSALYTANYIFFQLDRGSKTQRKDSHNFTPRFLQYIFDNKINEGDHVKVLKNYEEYRVRNDSVSSVSTGVWFLRGAIKTALDFESFCEQITEADYQYLYMLSKTKVAPLDEPAPLTLTRWIAEHTWLRRDDLGVGHEMYARLASPKATITSFRLTVEIAFLEIQLAKNALIDLFRVTGITVNDLPMPLARGTTAQLKDKTSHAVHIRQCFVNCLTLLREKFHATAIRGESLETAIRIFIADNVHVEGWAKYTDEFFSNKSSAKLSSIVLGPDRFLFSVSFLRDLAAYASESKSYDQAVPASFGEHVLFHWLMASQTVQASDIPKLTAKNFQFITRRDGRVTHLQLSYYKGRAQSEHPTRDIEARTFTGQGLLKFIKDRAPTDNPSVFLTIDILRVGITQSFSRFIHFLDTVLQDKINRNLASEKSSPVFLKCMVALAKNGISYNPNLYSSREDYWARCETPIRKSVFGPSLVKTTSVHASSDTFTPTQLINYHSHSNKTERVSYLTPANEDWVNNCGRITRAVMQDLAVNLFRASQLEKQIFNSEFTRSAEIISAKCSETLARMKLVTGKQDGSVDQIGFVSTPLKSNDPADTLYLVDSPETVMKLRHYLAQVSTKHHHLAKSAPEFLLFTVLPTTEWIESLFQAKRFRNVDQGDALYRKYRDILPPLFDSHIGG